MRRSLGILPRFLVVALCACSKSPDDCPDLGSVGWSAIAVDREMDLGSVFDTSVVVPATGPNGTGRVAVLLGSKPDLDRGPEVVVIDIAGQRTLGAWKAAELSTEQAMGFAGFWAPDFDADGAPELFVHGAGRLTAISVETSIVLWGADLPSTAKPAVVRDLDGDALADVLAIYAIGSRFHARLASSRDGSVIEEIDLDLVGASESSDRHFGVEAVVVDATSTTVFVVGTVRSSSAEADALVFARLELEPLRLLSSRTNAALSGECEVVGAWLSPDPGPTRLRLLTTSALLGLDPENGRVASRLKLEPWPMDARAACGDAGDFDGDLRSDFWRAAQTNEPGQPFSNGCRMAVHSGTSGEVLWEDGSTQFVAVDVLRDERGGPIAWVAGTRCPYRPLVRKPWPSVPR